MTHHLNPSRLLAATVAAAALLLPAVASAQDVPSYAVGPQPVAAGDQQITGTIASVNGIWNLTVDDANGYSDSVELHQGTIINPTGLTLEPGMDVTIDGYPDGGNFDAMEIDTPYAYDGPAPVPVYYGAGWWYPGYAYGWGPSFSLVFGFGGDRGLDRRAFAYGGEVRRAVAPPSGWQNRQHGYIGGNGFGGRATVNRNAAPAARYEQQRSYAGTTRTYSAPARSYAAPQARSFGYTQQARSYSAPQARSYSAPQARSYAAPQARSFGYTQQARSYSAPQARSYSAPQARSYSAPQARSYSAPQARSYAGGERGGGDRGRR